MNHGDFIAVLKGPDRRTDWHPIKGVHVYRTFLVQFRGGPAAPVRQIT